MHIVVYVAGLTQHALNPDGLSESPESNSRDCSSTWSIFKVECIWVLGIC